MLRPGLEVTMKEPAAGMPTFAMIMAAGVTGGPPVPSGGALVIEQIRTIDAPRVFHPGADDRSAVLEAHWKEML
jgi:hypothetical protein